MFVSLLFSLTSIAQADVLIVTCVDDRHEVKNYESLNTSGTVKKDQVWDTARHCDALSMGWVDISIDVSGDAFPTDVLVVYAVDTSTGELVPLDTVLEGISLLPVTDRNERGEAEPLIVSRPYMPEEKIDIVSLEKLEEIPEDSVVTVRLKKRDGSQEIRYMEAHQGVTFYTGLGVERGFWMPVGLYGATLTPEGLRLSLSPVALAWGFRTHLPRFYLGTSLTVAYTIVGGGDPGQDLLLKAGSAGLLFDVNDWVYVGPRADVSLAADDRGLVGWSVVVGPGARLLGVLKSDQ